MSNMYFRLFIMLGFLVSANVLTRNCKKKKP